MIIWNTLKLESSTGSVSATVSGTNEAPIWNFNHPINAGRITAETLTVTSSLDIPVKSIDYNKLTGTPDVSDLKVTNVATVNIAGITTATISNATINGGLVFGENAAPVILPQGSKIPGTNTDGLLTGNKYTVIADDLGNGQLAICNGSNKKLYCKITDTEPSSYRSMENSDRPSSNRNTFYLYPWEYIRFDFSIGNSILYCQPELESTPTSPFHPLFTLSNLSAQGDVIVTHDVDEWTDDGMLCLGTSDKLLIFTSYFIIHDGMLINTAVDCMKRVFESIYNLTACEFPNDAIITTQKDSDYTCYYQCTGLK